MSLKTSQYSIGDFVKISNNGERFWCEIIVIDEERNLIKTLIDNKISKECIVGKEDNKITSAQYGDTLWVGFDDIIGKWSES